jgi:hypothetical protein
MNPIIRFILKLSCLSIKIKQIVLIVGNLTNRKERANAHFLKS